MPRTAHPVEVALERLLALALDDPGLRAEHEASRAEFFIGGRPASTPDDPDGRLAARRHCEWFLLERPADSAGGVVPVAGLRERAQEEGGPQLADHMDALEGSFAGVFAVTRVRAGEGLWVRDMGGAGELALSEPEGSHTIECGDLLVGRLFPLEGEVFGVSFAAGLFRNAALCEAVERDMERARAERRGVLRVAQRELEALFWGSEIESDASEEGDPVGEARRVLEAGGVSPEDVDGVLEALGSEPYDAGSRAPGAADVLGVILDALAFETEVDLEAARRALLKAWPRLRGGGGATILPTAAAMRSRPARDRRAAMDAFDQGREEGQDLEQLFDQLERDLGLEPEPRTASQLASIEGEHPDFPGVVGAMVEEFLWEVEREEGPEHSAGYACLRQLGTFGQDIGVFENLGTRDLLRFAAFWVEEREVVRDADQARALVRALRAFTLWAIDRQHMPQLEAFRETLDGLAVSLPRIAEANGLLGSYSDEETAEDPGELLELLGPVGTDRAGVLGRDGERQEVSLDPELCRRLEPGDRLRARLPGGTSAIVLRCYPPECAGLEEA